MIAERTMNSREAGNSQRVSTLVRTIYDEINLALWAIGVALICYVVIVVVPRAPQMRERAEALRSEQINAENEWYCERWHMGPASAMHEQCVMDLQQLRTSIENRLAEENDI
jgi:hypothetical protein